jgi:hypothetical protein
MAEKSLSQPSPTTRLRRVFPGDRRVWIIAAIILLLTLTGVAIALLAPREDLLGSNSIGSSAVTAIVPANTQLCVPQLRIPAGTAQVRFDVDTRTAPRPELKLAIYEQDGRVIRGSLGGSRTGGLHFDNIRIPATSARPSSVLANVCLTPKSLVYVWGTPLPQANIPPPTIAGKPLSSRVAVWFLGPPGAHHSIASQIGEMFRRASLFRAGFVGEWTYWVLFLAVFPLLAYGSIRLLATADTPIRRRVPLPVLVGAIAFGVMASWALITPAFQSPDESEHFAYAQYFAETGQAVQTVQTSRPPYSLAEGFALEAVMHTSVIERREARPPWLPIYQREYQETTKREQLPRTNGGGFHPAISAHTPAYYALLAPGYYLTRGDSVFSQLLAMRLTSAIMGALIAVLAMLIVAELLPGSAALAVSAGLLVAFEPMFAFISGAVNNDNGVNLACALLIYLSVRALRRGLSPWLAVGAGATLVAAPLLKGTGYELYPAVLLALGFALWRRHDRRAWLSLGLLAATFAVLQFGWTELAPVFHRTTFTTPGGGAPGTTLGAFQDPKTYLSWLMRVLLPFTPPFIHRDWTIVHWPFFNIYIERGFASFGWYAIEFPKWVYMVIVVALGAAIAMGLRTLWREHALLRRRWPEITFLVLVPVLVFCAVEAAFQPGLGILPINGTPEQGRYLFPAITAIVALFIGACFGLGRRRAVPIATVAVACLIGLTLASQLLTLSSFYT